MGENIINLPMFQNEQNAREHLERLRWPNGPICPHCGCVDSHYRLAGESQRAGLLKCKECREQFTVTVGTVFERSKVPLHKWLLASYLMSSSKKGMSSLQLQRTLGVSYKTAWFMTHRIRHAMADPITAGKLGGRGSQYKVVEVDETYVGGKRKQSTQGSRAHKVPVVSLVERNGRVRSRVMPTVNAINLKTMIRNNVKKDSYIITDSFKGYRGLDREFHFHEMVNHEAKEYVRGQIHTNTVEGFFSLLKRGINGTFHHISVAHLDKYLAEFDFRHNHRSALGFSDLERTSKALAGIGGKRLMYRDPGSERKACKAREEII